MGSEGCNCEEGRIESTRKNEDFSMDFSKGNKDENWRNGPSRTYILCNEDML